VEKVLTMATMGEQGTTGLNQWQGRIQEDFLRELHGREGYKRYSEMRLNSAVVGALLLAIEQAIRGVTWTFTVEDSDESDSDPRVALLNEALKNCRHSMNDHITEALTMLPFGFAPFELVYERTADGRIMWKKFAFRSQDTVLNWLFDEKDSGEMVGFVQQAPPRYNTVTIPIDKLILYRTRVEKNNPEGRSILRTAWVSFYYEKNIRQIEAIGIERDLAGLPVIKLPPGADTTESASDTTDYGRASKLVRNIRQDEQAGVVLPDGWELELLSTGGSRQFDTDTIINRYRTDILMSALAQFLMLGQEGVGSLALSSDQTDFFTMSVNAVADIIAETLTKFAIPRLLKLNGMDATGVKLEHTPAGDVDLVALSDFLQKVGAMITWTPDDEAWLRGAAKLPEMDAATIQAARDQKAAEQIAMAQAARPPGAGGNEDDMGVDVYTSKADNERERQLWERRTAREMMAALAGVKQRVMKGARKIR
jgi:hypothetical protein